MSDQQEALQSGTTVRKPDGLVGKIARLEKELAAAKAEHVADRRAFEARLSALEPKRAPQSEPVEPEGVRVTILAPVSHFIMPSLPELLRLADIVRAYDRKFRFSDNAFASAFRVLGHFRRTETPNRKYYWHHWLDESEAILRDWGDNTEIAAAFLPAVIAHGDIPFSDWQADGVVLELGLDLYTGRLATDAWRRVLAGNLPTPVVTRMPPAPASRVRVTTDF